MNTIDTMRMLCDGRTSIHDIRALLLSMGHSSQDIADAFTALSTEAGSSFRVGSYQKDEYQAELFLTASS